MDFSRLDRRRDLILLRNFGSFNLLALRALLRGAAAQNFFFKSWPAALLSDAPLCWVASKEHIIPFQD